ncbi:MAG: hypothetical protein ACLSVG_00620 [Clostridia bacterium]
MSGSIDAYKEKIESIFSERIATGREKGRIGGYYRTIDTEHYAIYERARGTDRIIAAYGDMMIRQDYRNPNRLIIYPYYKNKWIKKRISLDQSTFPGLIAESRILLCTIWPYMRMVARDQYVKAIRINVITDKAQIFHNYPARGEEYEGFPKPGDIYRFEESVVWDLPGRKYPAKEENIKTEERYYPNLPEECYRFHPMLNTDPAFSDGFHNGGFGETATVKVGDKEEKVPRFYLYSREGQANPFHFIGTGERNYKMNLMATYRSNAEVGVRTCIFASSDGGRQWYCKYEFSDLGEYPFTQGHTGGYGRNFGNPIINDGYTSSGGISIKKRILVIPCENEKEPGIYFRWDDVGNAQIVDGMEQVVFETSAPHGLKTGNIVALTAEGKPGKSISWMLNNDISENSAGNGLLFKAEVINEKRFALYELVSAPDNNIPCRHIHHVNRIKDGWLIGTGEIYPNGWLFYLQAMGADTFTRVEASDEFRIVRLNSTEKSAQRTMGMILRDDERHTFIYASDHDCLERESFVIAGGRTEQISRNSTGIFEGKLSDIDDREKHHIIFEATEPCFYFQEINSLLFFCGQRGELGISNDGGKSWSRERIKEPIIHYYGSNGQRYYFDNCIFVRK